MPKSAPAPRWCRACTAKIRLISHRDRHKPIQRLQWPWFPPEYPEPQTSHSDRLLEGGVVGSGDGIVEAGDGWGRLVADALADLDVLDEAVVLVGGEFQDKRLLLVGEDEFYEDAGEVGAGGACALQPVRHVRFSPGFLAGTFEAICTGGRPEVACWTGSFGVGGLVRRLNGRG